VRRLLALAIALVALTLSAPAVAGDPTVGWQTMETDHFIIHYHEPLEPMARRVALYCEQAHAILAPLLDWEPAERTLVVLDDRVDAANGSATALPRNQVRLLATGPGARSALGDYDDWLRLLIIHEYAHILHIDVMSGFPAWLNRLFGKTSAPNQLLPRWYTEGFATYEESARTGGGRVRSSLYSMYLRAMWLDGTLFDLGELTGGPRLWPHGSGWYLYGGNFLAWVGETYGEDTFRRFHAAYGSLIFPYSMNTVLRETIGQDFVSLWQQWLAHLDERFSAELTLRRERGVTPVEPVTKTGEDAHFPRVRPGHREVTWAQSPPSAQRALFRRSLSGGEVSALIRPEGSVRTHSWDPTGRWVVYDNGRVLRGTYVFQELVLHDTATDTDLQITSGRRARDPDFGPSGRQIVYVENGEGRSQLAIWDLALQERRPLVEIPIGEQGQFDAPRFSPDGRFVVVSYWQGGGSRDLWAVEVASGKMRKLTADRALDIEPSWSPDGRFVLFASDRTNYYDIYAMDVSDLGPSFLRPAGACDPVGEAHAACAGAGLPVHRLTRMETGAFAPQVSASEDGDYVYLLYYTSRGFDLGRIPYEPATFTATAAPESQLNRPTVTYPELGDVVREHHSYQPWRYMAPQTFSPNLGITSGESGVYGLELFGSDPVGHHGWSFLGEYQSDGGSTFAAGNYGYSRLPVTLGLGLQHSTYRRERSLRLASEFVPFTEQAYDASLSLGVPVSSESADHFISLSYNLRQTDFFGDPDEPQPDPADLTPDYPLQGNFSALRLSYSVSETQSSPYSISTELGYSVNGSLSLRDSFTGADVKSVTARYTATGYLPVPFLDNHVLSLRNTASFFRSDYRGREQFLLGGIPRQQTVTALINETPLGGTYLRGFEPGAFRGEQIQLFSAEYRFPIWYVEQGFDTLPWRINTLDGALFGDVGSAFNGPVADAMWYPGVGLELRLRTTLGYALPTNFRAGYAYGFGSKGSQQYYFFYGGIF
jgi:hypothetical protein